MRLVGAIAMVALVGMTAGVATAGEPVRLGPEALDQLTAGRWQGFAVSKIGAQASGGAAANTRTANQASFKSTYQEKNGVETGSSVNVAASANGTASGSGPGPSSAGVGGLLIVSASKVPAND
ncbi:MAG: hypothetical protein NZ555_13490 [Geminicoccaceae bacterium]|nr:hypothetical protein [Geminicoccaceae bacterium]MDW8371180.1 hypothetical protein [Geminicoccaceae bacterium]